MTTPPVDLGAHYARARARIVKRVRTLSIEELATPVVATPGWSVADVVAHLTGIVEDALAGRLSGPPNDEQTAVEVARHRGRLIADVLADWDAGAPMFQTAITNAQIFPAVIDIISHEHDMRSALAAPGARDDFAVVFAATIAIEGLNLGADLLAVTFPDATTVRSVGDGQPTVTLHATPFDVVRTRLGRRTLDEVRALDWSTDPTPWFDRLFVFNPTTTSLGE
jgi:Mycothiol maleylpyruvate isomerase N-terminal domain